MERLPYKLPIDWTRSTWSPPGHSKELWEQRISYFSSMFVELEELSVGVFRDAFITTVPHQFLSEKINQCVKNNRVLVVLSKAQNNPNSYMSVVTPWDGKDFSALSYRVAICKDTETAQKIQDAYTGSSNHNDRVIGSLLGYPECCIEFFQKHWVEEQYLDLSWPAFVNSGEKADGPPEVNILLRWLGVRMVSHMPCSFNCQHSIKIANDYHSLIPKLSGDPKTNEEHWEYAKQLLSMPMQWSAKHGIAIIKTPLFKVSTRTDATGKLYTINKEGTFYPEDAPAGNSFPYRPSTKNVLTKGKSFKNSLVAIDSTLWWKDNGFKTEAGMNKAHEDLLDYVYSQTSPLGSIIDLGCGNGIFLEKVEKRSGAATCDLHGVEHNPEAARRAQFRNTHFTIHSEDIFSSESRWLKVGCYDYGFISSNRIYEWSQQTGLSPRTIIEWLLGYITVLYVTNYGDGVEYMSIIREVAETTPTMVPIAVSPRCVIIGKLESLTKKESVALKAG